MSRLILIDGSSYLYRAYYALPPLTTQTGLPTGAIHGVVNMLKRIIADEAPEHLAVIFDPKGKTFRHEFDPNYKANRSAMPEELAEQIPVLHDIIRAMGIPMLIKDGVEADDVIGTLTKTAEAKNMSVLISTGDKDMAQLVSDGVTLINTMNNQSLNPAGVVEKFGVKPEQIIDYLALIGDTSDNVPGVPKVGPKTAAKWLAKYQSVDSIVENAHEVSGKVGENLRNGLDQLRKSQFLVTIKCDVPLNDCPTDLRLTEPDTEALMNLAETCELKTWLKELRDQSNAPVGMAPVTNAAPMDTHQYDCVLSQEKALEWFEELNNCTHFAFDTETDGLDPHSARMIGFSVCTAAGKAAYFPIAHDDCDEQLDKQWLLDQLQVILESKTRCLIGQNIKFDLEVLHYAGVRCECKLFDTLLAAYVQNKQATRLNLTALSKQYLNHDPIEFEGIAGKGVKQLTFNQIPLEQATPYAAEDADLAFRLHECLKETLDADAELCEVFNTLDMPQVRILKDMECNGVLLDCDALNKQSEHIGARLLELEATVHELAGQEFNLASPKQLREILFEKLKLPVIKKTPKGEASTNEAVLTELALNYPLPKCLIEYRQLSKLKSTYTDRLPEQVNEKTGRVHTQYNQALTTTGRLSSNKPNLQNIPVKSEQGRKIRAAFIAPPDCTVLAADYSQIELRIIAHLSEDAGLLQAFADGLDIHAATASEVFNIPFDQVSKEQRRSAKAINFGLLYGMSAFGLAKQLGESRGTAQDYLDRYFQRYPAVRTYMDGVQALAHKQGYVSTLYGRRVYLPDINAKNKMKQQGAERAAINAPMQGTAADLMKLAMIAVDKKIQSGELKATLVMQVHDELVFEAKTAHLEESRRMIESAMCEVADLSVPLLVEIGVGDNWDEAH